MGKGKPTVTIYQKPTCSTCRETVKLVQASGRAFATVNYYQEPFSQAKLASLLNKASLKPRDFLRTKEDIYKKLGLAKKELSDRALIDLMLKHPDLIQRPLVEAGGKVILARPAETVKRIL